MVLEHGLMKMGMFSKELSAMEVQLERQSSRLLTARSIRLSSA